MCETGPDIPTRRSTARVEECGLTPEHAVADIASGTWIWTRMLLENGNRGFGVEPNASMRDAGEQLLGCVLIFYQHCRIGGDDQPNNCQRGFCTAAQAGHWFDRARARRSSFAY